MLDFGFLQRTGFTNPESSGKTEGHDRRRDGMEKHMDTCKIYSLSMKMKDSVFFPWSLSLALQSLQSFCPNRRLHLLPWLLFHTLWLWALTTLDTHSSVRSSDIMYFLLYENLQCLKSGLQLFLVIILLGDAFEFPTNYQPSPPVQKECGFSLWVPESPPAPALPRSTIQKNVAFPCGQNLCQLWFSSGLLAILEIAVLTGCSKDY